MNKSELEQLANMIADRVAERLVNLPQKQLVSRKDLADILSISIRKVDQLKHDGTFPCWKNGNRPLFDPIQCRRILELSSQ